MPHICLQLSGAPDATCTAAAVAQVQQLTQQLLGKDPALISVAVQQVPAHSWWVGGQTLADLSAVRLLSADQCDRRDQHQAGKSALYRGSL